MPPSVTIDEDENKKKKVYLKPDQSIVWSCHDMIRINTKMYISGNALRVNPEKTQG